ncbi:MAG TPA: M23 family metallopeptidase [Gemmatimonadaceae bacterium]|nr:M23 family metallopeptidase [Gemmatimonadaceae bacterium]
MTVRSARVITYTLVGLFSVVAIRLTPPVSRTPDNTVLGEFAAEPQLEIPAAAADPVFSGMSSTASLHTVQVALSPVVALANEPMVSPVLVVANDKEKIDTVTVSGTIKSSLFSALQAGDAALPRSARTELAFSLADIFEYRVDMSKDLQVGDKFHILVERLQKPNGAIIVNKIIGARLALSGDEIDAIRFDSPAVTGQYFDQTGKSLRASFLRAPVAFRRISSIFGGRRHPVLGIWRRHKGTDYAAASGTPVRAVGDGVVVFAGRKSGYGNVIDIRHRNGFVSRYGHLRNFAKGIHTGSRVSMGSTIAAVGMTGLATGPHLHFEILVNGVQRDPKIALRMKGGEPIPSAERGVFQQLRSRTLSAFPTLASAPN